MSESIDLVRVAIRISSSRRVSNESGVSKELMELIELSREYQPQKFRQIEDLIKLIRPDHYTEMLSERGIRIMSEFDAQQGSVFPRAASEIHLATSGNDEHRLVVYVKNAMNGSIVSAFAICGISYLAWSHAESYRIFKEGSWSQHDITYLMKALGGPAGVAISALRSIFKKKSPEFSEIGGLILEMLGSKDKSGFSIIDRAIGKHKKLEPTEGVIKLEDYRKKKEERNEDMLMSEGR